MSSNVALPFARPSKIVCVGRNYADHARELGNDVPREPLLFLKPPSSLVPSGQAIHLPAASTQVEYEGEIGVLLGRRLRDASEAEALASVAQLLAANDVTARDLQRLDSQWTRAKGFDTFCPVGVPHEPPADLTTLSVVTRVNGEERQRGTVAQMVFTIPFLLSYISRVMTLDPGDLVLTGTPAGVGALRAGDEVEVEVVGLSTVRNPVRAHS
ncbi:MAG TPA: fumarylacetoacetate hydrolase family protein [Gemmatimonadaceae bacterium]|nr:fumarylacetoacetate hydrolase family protein [Gemmatimonadaceae bacterium]